MITYVLPLSGFDQKVRRGQVPDAHAVVSLNDAFRGLSITSIPSRIRARPSHWDEIQQGLDSAHGIYVSFVANVDSLLNPRVHFKKLLSRGTAHAERNGGILWNYIELARMHRERTGDTVL